MQRTCKVKIKNERGRPCQKEAPQETEKSHFLCFREVFLPPTTRKLFSSSTRIPGGFIFKWKVLVKCSNVTFTTIFTKWSTQNSIVFDVSFHGKKTEARLACWWHYLRRRNKEGGIEGDGILKRHLDHWRLLKPFLNGTLYVLYVP